MIKSIFYYFLIARSGQFDRGYYLLNYPDVRKADINALWHFIRVGWKEGRNPSPFFNTRFYLSRNPDVDQSGINPLIHYIRHGRKEGRTTTPSITVKKNDKTRKQIGEKIKVFPVYSEETSKYSVKKNHDQSLIENIDLFVPKNKFDLKTNHIKNDLPFFDEKISIIIPTYNAGDDLHLLLKMLVNQQGFREIEVVIVDSGSNDRTVEIAREFHANIIEIASEDFSHSYARNLGAEKATGNYFFFTVQDALLPTTSWLSDLMKVMKNNDVGAVSCAELPRGSADLFYRVISWNHYQFLDVNDQDRILSMPSDPNYITLRKNGQLSDLACLIPADTFLKYKYRFNYAEDLDLGIRLIEDGIKIAFLGTTRIIHSHNRPANYFLKRGYVDNLFLSDIFSDFPVSKLYFEDVINDIAFSFHFIYNTICNELSKNNFPIKTGEMEKIIVKSIQSSSKFKFPKKINIEKNTYIDKNLKFFIKQSFSDIKSSKPGQKYNGTLLINLIGFVNITFNYLKLSHEMIDEYLLEDIKTCLFKEISLLSGAQLAHCYVTGSVKQKMFMEDIHIKLQDKI